MRQSARPISPAAVHSPRGGIPPPWECTVAGDWSATHKASCRADACVHGNTLAPIINHDAVIRINRAESLTIVFAFPTSASNTVVEYLQWYCTVTASSGLTEPLPFRRGILLDTSAYHTYVFQQTTLTGVIWKMNRQPGRMAIDSLNIQESVKILVYSKLME